MKKLITFCFLFLTLTLSAREINPRALQNFSSDFKEKLEENSYTGLFCYVSPKERRIIGCDDFNKMLNLGDSSNIITNYLAFKLEKEGVFDRNTNIRNYAKIFKYNAKKISFADLISSTALVSRHLDKIYPNDAKEYEYFDFLWQLNPSLMSGANYEYSKISNLGAVYALSYSQGKNPNALISTFENLIDTNLIEFPSLYLYKSENNLYLNFSMNVKDLTEYLSREIQTFSAKPQGDIKRGNCYNAWVFSEVGLTRVAMVAGQHRGSYLIANFYDRDVAVAIFIDNANDEKARNFLRSSLQDFVLVLNN